MNTKYNKIKLAMQLHHAQDAAYEYLTQKAKQAAQAPTQSRKDRFVRLAKVATFDGIRRYQFFRPDMATCTVAVTADAIFRAARASRGHTLLPLGTPFLLTSVVLYALVGTGRKASFAAPNASRKIKIAATLTQSGILGIPQIVAYRSGRKFEKAGLDTLAQACYVAATCFCWAVEPLRAAVVCTTFVLQMPYALVATLLNLGVTAASAAYQNDLSPQSCLIGADDLFDAQEPRSLKSAVKEKQRPKSVQQNNAPQLRETGSEPNRTAYPAMA